ncbi:MAG: hypothetical protein LH650_15990 [Chloroflexi bacterium]|nr:hypothetical protein [Chloroflexota bacterium]
MQPETSPPVLAAPDLATLDAPVRRLFERIAPALDGSTPDVGAVAAAMIELATDHDYLLRHIRIHGDVSGSTPLHAPARGPRLMLAHRLAGQMGAIHDHGCWVALTPVTGVETHRHFRVHASGDQIAQLELASEQAVAVGQAVTMLTPQDTHAHGHVPGSGDPAYVLIMTGDDQRQFRRSEWDAISGARRILEPGDGGRWIDTLPFPAG